MAEIVFLSVEMVIELHLRSLREHGGSDGIRDRGGLESAVGQAKNAFYYGNADTFGVAAAYAIHIAEAQAFVDGNKRTAIASALLSLELAGIPLSKESSIALYDAIIAIANREMDKAGLAALFRSLFIAEP